ncbi:MAG: sulfurtransferase [Silicimonas sp.]|nr:sulfurtransferase [Silicimonas sp.]
MIRVNAAGGCWSILGFMDTLVSTDWLSRHLDDPELVVLDCTVETDVSEAGLRNSSGYDTYLQGHIPGAGFADLKGGLSDPANPVEFTPPSPEDFCAAMGRLGVGDSSRVVLYDRSYSAWAARVWWMLRWVGFDRAAILDGGFGAWSAEGRAVSTDAPQHPMRYLKPHPRPRLIADRDEVLAAIDDPKVNIIDTLMPEMYRGETAMYGRPGHIPTAINISGPGLLDETGHLKPKADLDAMHALGPDERAITYCGGGILASLNAFVMTRLGYKDVAVYTASLQEWAEDPSLPMTTDA